MKNSAIKKIHKTNPIVDLTETTNQLTQGQTLAFLYPLTSERTTQAACELSHQIVISQSYQIPYNFVSDSEQIDFTDQNMKTRMTSLICLDFNCASFYHCIFYRTFFLCPRTGWSWRERNINSNYYYVNEHNTVSFIL